MVIEVSEAIELPIFKIGDIVYFRDEYSNNPASKTICIAKVEAVYIQMVEPGSWFGDKQGDVEYSVSGYSSVKKEKDLEPYIIDVLWRIKVERKTGQLSAP